MNRLGRLLKAPLWLMQAVAARRYARHRGLDVSFADFGTRLGLRLAVRLDRDAAALLLSPVHDIRYWEFGYVWARITGTRCLDASSPRLMSLRLAAEQPRVQIVATNPDRRDAEATRRWAAALALRNVVVRTQTIEELGPDRYDSVWSISVIEHVDDDTAAAARLWSAVIPGGRLLLTVPVDREHWDEFRDRDEYGLREESGVRVFFQRFYTAGTVQSRLLNALVGADIELSWWGERNPGSFHAHIDRWRRRGYQEIVHDPRLIVDGYRAFDTWEEMPGVGVCGIEARKGLT